MIILQAVSLKNRQSYCYYPLFNKTEMVMSGDGFINME